MAKAPREADGARIWTLGPKGEEQPASELRPAGAAWALDLGFGARIELPCPAEEVMLALISGSRAGAVAARDAKGKVVDRSEIPQPKDGVAVIRLTGKRIAEVVFDLPQDETMLLALCWRCADRTGAANPEKVEVRYFAGQTLLHADVVAGNPGDVVETTFTSDLVTSVDYMRADAALVDVCYVPVRQAVGGKWTPLRKAGLPIALPVRDPDYPASGALSPDPGASEAEALGRIAHGDPADWQGAGGSGALRGDRGTRGPRTCRDPRCGTWGRTTSPGHRGGGAAAGDEPQAAPAPNLLMIGALEPQVAQMLGLYWVDDTARPGERYDYMIAADHGNVAGGDPFAMLSHLANPAANPFLADAWVCFDLALGTPAPLAQPGGLRAYALPGSTREAADGALDELEQNAGFRRTIPTLGTAKLAEGAPVLYWIRRAALGDTAPGGPVDAGDHKPVTDRPHAVTEPRLPPGVTDPARAADWPPFAMHYIDSGLAEGWYSYRLTAIDIFGGGARRPPRPNGGSGRPRRGHGLGAALVSGHRPGRRGGERARNLASRQGRAAAARGGGGLRARSRRPEHPARRPLHGVVRDPVGGRAGERDGPAGPLALEPCPDAAGPRRHGGVPVYLNPGLANTFKGRIAGAAANGAASRG